MDWLQPYTKWIGYRPKWISCNHRQNGLVITIGKMDWLQTKWIRYNRSQNGLVMVIDKMDWL